MTVLWENSQGTAILGGDYKCTDAEIYIRRPLVSGHMGWKDSDGHYYPITGHSHKVNTFNGRAAGFIKTGDGDQHIKFIQGSVLMPDEEYYNISFTVQYQDLSYGTPTYFMTSNISEGTAPSFSYISTNVPIFNTELEAETYVKGGDNISDAINYEASDVEPDETYTYHLYNGFALGRQVNGEMTQTATSLSHNNIRVQCNKRPVMWFTGDNTYSMNIAYDNVISWYGNHSDVDISNIPLSSFTQGAVVGHQAAYGNQAAYIYAKGQIPVDNDYTYGFLLDTDFAIFADEDSAITALYTGQYSGAANWPQISNGNTLVEIETGDEESSTTFGSGAFVSPFCNVYVMGLTALQEVANAFYTDDQTLLTNIKNGLELFGANPYEAIIGLSAFPCDVTELVGTSGQQYVYFGSYQKTLTNTVYKVINREAKYINAGNVYLAPIFKNFRDFEPWTELHVYLPFCGWQKLDIASYIGKNVNIRYYIDIMTRSGVVVLIADGVMMDYFTTGEIGIELPIAGQNLSRYANDTLNALLQAGGGTVGGAISGAMVGSAVPGIGTAVGAVGGALLGGGFGLTKGAFDMSQKGKPKDHNMTKGNFSGGCGCYMPYYVTFRFTVHDVIEPENLNALYGKPSSYGGRLGNLSGFAKIDTIKMNTSGMSDSNITEVVNLVKEGIFL